MIFSHSSSKNLWWIIGIFLLRMIVVTPKKYSPIRIYEHEENLNMTILSLDYSEKEMKGKTLNFYCSWGNIKRDEYIITYNRTNNYYDQILKLKDPAQDNRLENIALGKRGSAKYNTTDIECEFPVIIAQEKEVYLTSSENHSISENLSTSSEDHSTSSEDHSTFSEDHSISSTKAITKNYYGFYVPVQESKNAGYLEWNAPFHFSLVGAYRIANRNWYNFVELYESIDNEYGSRQYFYTLPLKNAQRYATAFNGIVQSIEKNDATYSLDECFGQKIEKIYQNTFLDKFSETITENPRKETFQRYRAEFAHFKFAYLVPPMHLLFDGYESLQGNCTGIVVWDAIYEYLLEVDKAIYNLVVKHKKDAEIKTGYAGTIQTFNKEPFMLLGLDHQTELPALIWKEVRFSEKGAKQECSFVVTIANNVFQNVSEKLSPFKNVNSPCSLSCTSIGVDILKQKRKRVIDENKESESLKKKAKNRRDKFEVEGIVNCCRLSDENWVNFSETWVSLF